MDPAGEEKAAHFLEEAEAFWKSRNSSLTPVRRILCRELVATESPVDAEDLLRRARSHDKLISLSTVYRTLSTLAGAGLLDEVEGQDGKRHYCLAEYARSGSSYLICGDCGRVISVDDPCLGLREGAKARERGFSPRKITLRMEVRCDRLRNEGHCEYYKG